MVSPSERHQLLIEWNNTAVPRSPWPLLHEIFEVQATRTPDAPAATFEGETLTYARLGARANRLARHLRALGCGPESRVGAALERSLDLLVALLVGQAGEPPRPAPAPDGCGSGAQGGAPVRAHP